MSGSHEQVAPSLADPAHDPGSDPVGGSEIERRGFPGLNALRAAGALMVVLTHCAFDTGQIRDGWPGAVLARFDFGVALFFVLSGFLLSRPFLQRAAQRRSAPSARLYLWKRALRILPLYWTVVLLAMIAEPANRGVAGTDWLRNLSLTQLYYAGLLPVGLTQMWSLATEAAFYVILPLLCAVLLGRPGRFAPARIYTLLALISVAGIIWQAHVVTIPGADGHYAQWLPGYLPWFAVGIALATVSVDEQINRRAPRLLRLSSDPLGCWLLAAAVFALACTPLAGPRDLSPSNSAEAVFKVMTYAVAAGLFVLPLVFGDQQQGRLRRGCSARVPFFLGEISFGIFCLHVLVMKAVFRATDTEVFTGHFGLIAISTIAVTLVLATVAHYVVERPFLRLKNRIPREPAKTATEIPAATKY